jgi:hypothetical protein
MNRAWLPTLGLAGLVFLPAWPAVGAAEGLNTSIIEARTGLKGSMNDEENVFKVTWPRTDLKVSVDGWTLPPFMGLTTWAAFTPGKKRPAMVTGDLVLAQDEVNPAMSAALEKGLQVTALHNHFFYDEPRVYFMHIEGEGTDETLASAVGAAVSRVKEVRAASSTPARSFGVRIATFNAVSLEPIESVIGVKGQRKDGMVKIVIGRKARMDCGCDVGKEMGVNTWAAFAGTDQQTVVDGDFAMTEDELQGVLKALRAAKINVVAIHNHMTKEEPRIVFLHYWGAGPAAELAKGVRSALDTQKKGS